MNNSIEKEDMAFEEIDLIGKDFASRFYDAFAGQPDTSALLRSFDRNSKYSFVQKHSGRPDYHVQGADMVGELAERMQYGRCVVNVRSVDTIRMGATMFKVSAAGELLHPDNDVARKFLQTIVIKRVPWTRTEFTVVDTVFEFDDLIIDDVLPRAGASGSEYNFKPSKLVVAATQHVVDVGRRKSAKPFEADGRRYGKVSRHPTGNCNRRYVRTMDVFNSNTVKSPAKPEGRVVAAVGDTQKVDSKTVKNPPTNPQQPSDALKGFTGQLKVKSKVEGHKNVASSIPNNELVVASPKDKKSRCPANRDARKTSVRKAKNAAKDPMADSVPSYIGGTIGVSNANAKRKSGNGKLTAAATGSSLKKSCPSTDNDCGGVTRTTMVSEKKPLALTQPDVMKTAIPKVESKETPSTGEKAITTVVEVKPNGKRSAKLTKKRPTCDVGNARIFVSINRFGCLADGDSCPSDDESSINQSEKSTNDFSEPEKSPERNLILISAPTVAGPEQTTATGIAAEKQMSTTTSIDSSPKVSGEKTKSLVVRDPSPVRDEPSVAVVPDGPIVVLPLLAGDDTYKEELNRDTERKNRRKNKKPRTDVGAVVVNDY